MDPFIGQIMMFGGNFPPRGWALCDGQLLSISSNQALFSILGTTYGGDGRTTFGLPDLRGRVPMHPGHGSGLTQRNLGQRLGSETATLTKDQIPAHSHTIRCVNKRGNDNNPLNAVPAVESSGAQYSTETPDESMAAAMVPDSGGNGASHNNVQPSGCVNFCIALVGVFPSRN